MVAQAFENPLSSEAWENQTTPMPGLGITEGPICLVKSHCMDATDVICKGVVKNTWITPKKAAMGYVRAEGVPSLTKQVISNPNIQNNGIEKPKEEVFREYRTKKQLQSNNSSRPPMRDGELLRPFYKKSIDTELIVSQEATVSSQVHGKGRNEKSNNEVQDNSNKEETIPPKSRHDGSVVISPAQSGHQNKENTSEGAATLLLLADSNQCVIRSPERADVYTQFVSESEPKQKRENYKPEGSRIILNEPYEDFTEDQNLSGRDNEELSPDDDDDSNRKLIMDLTDSSVDVQPAYEDQEREEPDDANSSDGSDTKDDGGSKHVDSGHSRSNNRVESKKKVENAEAWLRNIMALAGSLCILRLGDIEDSYLAFCKENDKEPLATPVLARLIHKLFPEAEKCRLGPRGNQRIHYRNLRFKNESDAQTVNQTSKLQNVTKVHPQNSTKESEDIKSKQPDASRNQNTEIDNVIDECTEKQNENNLTSENKESLINQIETEDSPKKNENQAIQSQDDEESCKAAAKKLTDVLKWISDQGENHKKALLRDFAHSASCQDNRCLPVCMMFRRVRRHVVAAKHCCSVLRLYSMLLRNHVSSCTSDNCGLPACPALQKTRIQKRSLEMEREGNSPKRAAVSRGYGLLRPGSIALAPRSPGGSLPGSPVNSPPLSPEILPGQVQYVLVPFRVSVMENKVV